MLAKFALQAHVLSPDQEFVRSAAEATNVPLEQVVEMVTGAAKFVRDRANDANANWMVDIEIEVVESRLWVTATLPVHITTQFELNPLCVVVGQDTFAATFCKLSECEATLDQLKATNADLN